MSNEGGQDAQARFLVDDPIETLVGEAAGLARSLGLPFARTATVGSAPAVMAGLADLVLSRSARPETLR